MGRTNGVYGICAISELLCSAVGGCGGFAALAARIMRHMVYACGLVGEAIAMLVVFEHTQIECKFALQRRIRRWVMRVKTCESDKFVSNTI